MVEFHYCQYETVDYRGVLILDVLLTNSVVISALIKGVYSLQELLI